MKASFVCLGNNLVIHLFVFPKCSRRCCCVFSGPINEFNLKSAGVSSTCAESHIHACSCGNLCGITAGDDSINSIIAPVTLTTTLIIRVVVDVKHGKIYAKKRHAVVVIRLQAIRPINIYTSDAFPDARKRCVTHDAPKGTARHREVGNISSSHVFVFEKAF